MPPGRTASCLIGGNTITKDFIIAHRILSLPAAIAGITLDGIDNSIFAFLHNAHMIGKSILGAGGAIRGIPVKENNHARCWLNAIIGPLTMVFEPLDAVHATCEFWNDAVFDTEITFDFAINEFLLFLDLAVCGEAGGYVRAYAKPLKYKTYYKS